MTAILWDSGAVDDEEMELLPLLHDCTLSGSTLTTPAAMPLIIWGEPTSQCALCVFSSAPHSHPSSIVPAAASATAGSATAGSATAGSATAGSGQSTPTIDRGQRSVLAAEWLDDFRKYLTSLGLSEKNFKLVMKRVEELSSGAGVQMNQCSMRAFEGRKVMISDDLEALLCEVKQKFLEYDVGGWKLRHPLGKMIMFKKVPCARRFPAH